MGHKSRKLYAVPNKETKPLEYWSINMCVVFGCPKVLNLVGGRVENDPLLLKARRGGGGGMRPLTMYAPAVLYPTLCTQLNFPSGISGFKKE